MLWGQSWLISSGESFNCNFFLFVCWFFFSIWLGEAVVGSEWGQGGQGCPREALHRCVKMAEPLMHNIDFVFPSRTQDVATVCRSIYSIKYNPTTMTPEFWIPTVKSCNNSRKNRNLQTNPDQFFIVRSLMSRIFPFFFLNKKIRNQIPVISDAWKDLKWILHSSKGSRKYITEIIFEKPKSIYQDSSGHWFVPSVIQIFQS